MNPREEKKLTPKGKRGGKSCKLKAGESIVDLRGEGCSNRQSEPKKGKKPRKQLSVKEQLVKKALLEGKSKKHALLSAGYAESTAETKQTEIVERVVGKSGFVQTLERAGMTDEKLAEKAVAGLDAQKVISAMVVYGKPDGSPGEKMTDAGGMTKDFIEVDDWDAQHKFLTTGLKLKGHLKEKVEAAVTFETYEERRRRLGLDKG
jgi:hypothetical protein